MFECNFEANCDMGGTAGISTFSSWGDGFPPSSAGGISEAVFPQENEEFRYVVLYVSTRSTMTKGNRVMQPPHCLHNPLVVE